MIFTIPEVVEPRREGRLWLLVRVMVLMWNLRALLALNMCLAAAADVQDNFVGGGGLTGGGGDESQQNELSVLETFPLWSFPWMRQRQQEAGTGAAVGECSQGRLLARFLCRLQRTADSTHATHAHMLKVLSKLKRSPLSSQQPHAHNTFRTRPLRVIPNHDVIPLPSRDPRAVTCLKVCEKEPADTYVLCVDAACSLSPAADDTRRGGLFGEEDERSRDVMINPVQQQEALGDYDELASLEEGEEVDDDVIEDNTATAGTRARSRVGHLAAGGGDSVVGGDYEGDNLPSAAAAAALFEDDEEEPRNPRGGAAFLPASGGGGGGKSRSGRRRRCDVRSGRGCRNLSNKRKRRWGDSITTCINSHCSSMDQTSRFDCIVNKCNKERRGAN